MSTYMRACIVAEAYEWLNTPYVNCGAVKGPRGAVDCAMMLVCIFQNVGLLEKTYDPRPYSPDWHLHQNRMLYREGLLKYAHEVSVAQPGDVAMYRFGRHAAHGAIIVDERLLIHAHKQDSKVSLYERSTVAERLDSYWSMF